MESIIEALATARTTRSRSQGGPDSAAPTDPAELLELIEREPKLGALAGRLLQLLEQVDGSSHPRRLAVKSERGGLLFVEVERIDWIDAAGKSSRINAEGKIYRLRETIGALEQRLDPRRFFRIHRSTLVNVEKIREIRPRSHGNHIVTLDDGTRLNLTRGARGPLVELLLRERPEASTATADPAS